MSRSTDIFYLLRKKEEFRQKHGIHIENSHCERGSMNHKTKQYWTVELSRREPSTSKGRNYNHRISFASKDSYEKALIQGLENAQKMIDGVYKLT